MIKSLILACSVKNGPGVYVATGFQKWGMTSSMAAAEILTDFICGRENGDAPVFSPQRFHPFVSTPKLLIDGAQTVYSIAKEKLEIPRETLFAIPNGTAAVVKVEGRRWAYIKRRTAARIVSPCAARISGAGLNGTRRNCHGIARATGQGLITRGNCSMIRTDRDRKG